MQDLNIDKTCALSDIMECELAGVVRYTHYSIMVSGPYRIPIVDFMKAQPIVVLHAQQVGEILTPTDIQHKNCAHRRNTNTPSKPFCKAQNMNYVH